MKEIYEITVAGLERKLPICKVSDDLYIAGFVIFGDVELTKACAAELIKKIPDHDIIITAEAKGIPLAYEMASMLGNERHLVARKAAKLYMRDPLETRVKSISTEKEQTLYLDRDDAEFIRGKRVVIVDDVISTGESLYAVEKLVENAGGKVVGRMAILAEGEASEREDIVYLEKLPLFDGEGNVIE